MAYTTELTPNRPFRLEVDIRTAFVYYYFTVDAGRNGENK